MGNAISHSLEQTKKLKKEVHYYIAEDGQTRLRGSVIGEIRFSVYLMFTTALVLLNITMDYMLLQFSRSLGLQYEAKIETYLCTWNLIDEIWKHILILTIFGNFLEYDGICFAEHLRSRQH